VWPTQLAELVEPHVGVETAKANGTTKLPARWLAWVQAQRADRRKQAAQPATTPSQQSGPTRAQPRGPLLMRLATNFRVPFDVMPMPLGHVASSSNASPQLGAFIKLLGWYLSGLAELFGHWWRSVRAAAFLHPV